MSTPHDQPPPEMSVGEIRQKALAGVATVGLRAFAIRGLGLAANLVLARLLVPEEFGILAFGQTLVMFSALITDVGFAAALVGQHAEPRREQLQAFFGLQLAAATGFALVGTVVLLNLGRIGEVAAVMIWSVAVAAIGGVRVVVLERRLDYRSIAQADVIAAVLYMVLAIGLVAIGFGVWGVAIAHVLRSACQSVVLVLRTRDVPLRPRLAWAPIRHLLGFGVTYQARTLIELGREQVINLGTLILAGTSVLGLWSLAQRLLLIPFLLFEALWRVSFPAIARLVARDADPAVDIARALRIGAVATGLLLVGLAASAPLLIPSAFGEEWTDVADVVPPAALGLLVSGPISAAGAGYLYAIGRPGQVLAGVTASAVVWLIALPVAVPRYGIQAHGWCWLAASLAEASILGAGLRRGGVPVFSSVLPPVLVGTAVALPVLLVLGGSEPSLALGLGVALGATLVFMALITMLRPATIADGWRLSRRMLTRRTAPVAPSPAA